MMQPRRAPPSSSMAGMAAPAVMTLLRMAQGHKHSLRQMLRLNGASEKRKVENMPASINTVTNGPASAETIGEDGLIRPKTATVYADDAQSAARPWASGAEKSGGSHLLRNTSMRRDVRTMPRVARNERIAETLPAPSGLIPRRMSHAHASNESAACGLSILPVRTARQNVMTALKTDGEEPHSQA